MRGINKAIIVGNIGRDPETRYLPSGVAVTEISVATSEQWKDKQTGEQQERTEWHKIKFFGRLAEIAGEYLKKGGQVYVEGKIRTDEYEKDGVKRWTTYVLADTLQMLGAKPSGSGQGQSRGAPRGPQQPPQRGNSSAPAGGGETFDDDEIPF